jgi:hypothetical protein
MRFILRLSAFSGQKAGRMNLSWYRPWSVQAVENCMASSILMKIYSEIPLPAIHHE